MGLVYDNQVIVPEIIHQTLGRFPGLRAAQMSGIVLYAGAETRLPQHLHIKIGALRDPLSLDQLVLPLEEAYLLLQFDLNVVAGPLNLLCRHHIMGGREDGDMVEHRMHLARQRLHLGDPVNLVPEKFHPDQIVSALGRVDLYHISMHPESPPLQIHIIAVILDVHQFPQHLVPVLDHTRPQGHDHLLVIVRTAQTVDTGHAGHHDHVPAFGQRGCGGQPQFINLIVDGGILGNICVRGWHIGLRLVIVIIGHKILHCIFREKFLELAVELSRQGFVVGNDQSGLVQRRDHIGHGKSLTGTGDPQQSLALIALPESFNQGFNGLGLIAGGLI